MNTISSLSGLQWAFLAAVPPAVLLLYFLKLRRQPRDVPSTFLWQRTIEDMHVNSLWQKLKTSLLLLLQMLFLAFLIIACLRPGMNSNGQSGKRWIFLVDNSASMAAIEDGQSRLVSAKKMIAEKLNSMDSGDVGMVLAFSDRADVRQGFTEDRRRLLMATNSIEQTNRTTSLDEALRAAAGLANPGRVSFDDVKDYQVADAVPADLFVYSDGGVGKIEMTSLGKLNAQYIPVGSPTASNVAIVAFSVESNVENKEEVEAFGRVANFGDEPIEATASLYRGDLLLDAAEVSVAADGETGVSFTIPEADIGEIRLEIDYDDALPIDNVAYAAIRPKREKNVLFISEGNAGLETALATNAILRVADIRSERVSFLQTEEYQALVSAAEFDLVIYDQCKPEAMPLANTLFINEVPPIDGWEATEPQGPVFILDIDRTHPMIEYLEMNSVRIVESKALTTPEGGSSLMTSNIGPVMAIAPRMAFQDAVIAFRLVSTADIDGDVNTDWTIKRSFPIFVFSAVKYLAGGVTDAAAASILPGDSIGMSLQNSINQYEIETPSGKKVGVDRGVQSQVVFTQTEDPGLYSVRPKNSDALLEMFAVNLFSNRESDIRVAEELQFGETAIAGQIGTVEKRIEFWRYLLFGGLGFLLLEWLVYNRRVFI
jgi:hypothetical protein